MTTPRRLALLLALASLCLATAACRSQKPAPPQTVSAGPGNRPWYAGTDEMQKELNTLIRQVPSTTGAGRIELSRRIVAYGEPAVPILVKALSDPDREMRTSAAWMLGFLKDPRTTSYLVEATRDSDPLVRYEAAATLVRLQDMRGIHVLIRGLEDPDPRIRQKAHMILQTYTGKGFGYRVDGAPDDRAAAAARWRAWAAGLSGMPR